jgi:two-component system, OmpR family, copper resistance phosphate regulon response regulator CusR
VRILVIEDDGDIRDAVERGLRAAGFAVDAVADLPDARLASDVNHYDTIVADRMLPSGDALDLVADLRTVGNTTPALFLTTRDAVADRVDGFDVGGDDYLVKPFALEELVARVRSLCRRRDRRAPVTVVVGDLEINGARAEVRRNGVLLPLTTKERCVLGFLADNAGVVVARTDLIEHCWDEVHDPMSNVIDAHVASLRRKLGQPNPIRTVRGTGFVLDVPDLPDIRDVAGA